mmetsp:Transcript_107125/g.301496  ORF Transcript_107125/g.301496 Transcript_107125/m.301496 type:complete len:200 (-) Transcript_107125:1010-1609(-)
MGAVVEEGHVEGRGQALQKAEQRPWPLRKFEAEQHLLLRQLARGTPSNQVPRVCLRELVRAEILGCEARRLEVAQRHLQVLFVRRLETHQDARGLPADPVGELRDVSGVDVPVELEEGTGPLWNLDSNERLGSVRTFGDEPEPVEVHVCAASHRDEGFALRCGALGIPLQPSEGERTGGFQHDTSVDEGILDRRADVVS